VKKIYWRPGKVSRRIHLFVALMAALGLLTVETVKTRTKQPHYAEKMKAARLMRDSMTAIRDYRLKRLGPIDRETDPAGSGMIGTLMSPITSNTGNLEAKQTTVNPNWAAVLVDLLKRAGVKKGDYIAIGFSGSFPAMNLATYCAAAALELNPVAISGASASMWGANEPDLTWLKMEKLLYDQKILPFRSSAATLGGQGDKALGMSKKGLELLQKAITESGLPMIYTSVPKENIDIRMETYKSIAKDSPIVVYVNVGGGTVSVGTAVGKKLFKPGLNRRPPARALSLDSVMTRFAKDGVPIIHLSNIVELARRYQLPQTPQSVPSPGDGVIFWREEYNLWAASAILALLCGLLFVLIRMDLGARLFSGPSKSAGPQQPQQMV